MVPQQFELSENQQQRIRVDHRVDAVELAGIASADAGEWPGPRDPHRRARNGGDAPLEPRLGPPYCGPFGLGRGSARRHDRGHLGAIAAAKRDLGAEVASEAVANEDAGGTWRRERPLPETGHDRGIGLVTDRGPPT